MNDISNILIANIMPIFIIQSRLNKVANKPLAAKCERGNSSLFQAVLFSIQDDAQVIQADAQVIQVRAIAIQEVLFFLQGDVKAIQVRAIVIQGGDFLIWGKLGEIGAKGRVPEAKRVVSFSWSMILEAVKDLKLCKIAESSYSLPARAMRCRWLGISTKP